MEAELPAVTLPTRGWERGITEIFKETNNAFDEYNETNYGQKYF
jgi:hypothetical protein